MSEQTTVSTTQVIINKAVTLAMLGMILLWIFHFFKPSTPVKQLNNIAQNKKDWMSTNIMIDRKEKRWVFIVFSDEEVIRIKELNAFLYKWEDR